MTKNSTPAPVTPMMPKRFHRFDVLKATNGVGHHIVDDAGNDYGTWTTSYFDATNRFIEVAQERFRHKFATDPRMKSDYANVFAFVQVCLQGWSGVYDDNGTEVPFDRDVAFNYICACEDLWFFQELVTRSTSIEHYRGKAPATNQTDVAGN